MKQEYRIQFCENTINKARQKYRAVVNKEVTKEAKRMIRELRQRYKRHKFSVIIKHQRVQFLVCPAICGENDIREIPPHAWRGAIEDLRQEVETFKLFAENVIDPSFELLVQK